MSYSLQPITDITPGLMSELAGNERFVTHAHNPCIIDILTKTFGWNGAAFLVLEDENPVGYIPCMFVKGRIVSVPHFSFGGLLTRKEQPQPVYNEILPAISGFFSGTKAPDISYLIRDTFKFGDFSQVNKVISWIDIKNKSIHEVIPAAQLSKARKSVEKGLICVVGGEGLLYDFYAVYSRNMLRLGSPVLPKRFFANILRLYKNGDARIFCVYKEKSPVGASFLMSYLGFFENTWFSTLNTYNPLFPAQLLHKEMMSFAIQQGGNTYSFGRSSTGSGVHEFKRRWGTDETVVYWNYDRPVKVDIRKAEFFQQLWKFLPLAVANKLGPVIAGRIY